MTDLISKLEALTGPSREVDAAICIALQYGGKNGEHAKNVRVDPDWDDGDILFEIGNMDCCNPIPELTGSLDAAIALVERVLPGWQFGIEQRRAANGGAMAWCAPNDESRRIRGATPAIALLIALLKAKEAADGR